MDKREEFKVAALAICADAGMSLGETLTFFKQANQVCNKKQAADGWGTGLLNAGKTLGVAGLLAPPVLGAGLGWGAARLSSGINDSTPKEIKHQEIIDELRRQTERAKLHASIAERKKQRQSRRGRSLI